MTADAFLKFLDACGNRISDGTPFEWTCFGDQAHYVVCEFGNQMIAEAVYSRRSLNVFQIAVWSVDERTEAYYWTVPDRRAEFSLEVIERGGLPFDTIEGTSFVSITSFADMITKIKEMSTVADEDEFPRLDGC